MEAEGKPVNKQSARELQQNVAAWKKRNKQPEPPLVESHDDAGKLVVGGKPIDSVAVIVPIEDVDDEQARDDVKRNTYSDLPAPETQDDPVEEKSSQRALEQASLPAQVDDKLQQLKKFAAAKLADVSDWLERTNDFQAVEKLVALLDSFRSD